MWSESEAEFMRRALEVAEQGQGRVSPNPPVGCVLVKDGVAIAEGWHDHLGGLHAEQMAIHDAEARGVPTNGATAYVTLEPCNHFGRTPPCTESLLWAGIQRVVVA
ncbi:MAG: bifunctional diaminohydroxyphosphoribosylaminopyrimidine deaminase/5-amino-6-(5-phosphoribosylamino)uracil reductase RibD, partial [Candidatus Poseidoniaceae archaeon]